VGSVVSCAGVNAGAGLMAAAGAPGLDVPLVLELLELLAANSAPAAIMLARNETPTTLLMTLVAAIALPPFRRSKLYVMALPESS
jgi:hypothetical protein